MIELLPSKYTFKKHFFSQIYTLASSLFITKDTTTRKTHYFCLLIELLLKPTRYPLFHQKVDIISLSPKITSCEVSNGDRSLIWCNNHLTFVYFEKAKWYFSIFNLSGRQGALQTYHNTLTQLERFFLP